MEGAEIEEKYIVRLKFQDKFMFVGFRESELTVTNFPEKGKFYLAFHFPRKSVAIIHYCFQLRMLST